MISGEKDETDYSERLREQAENAATAVFKLNRKCHDTYGDGFTDCDDSIMDIREKQDLICEVDSILRGIKTARKKAAK